jgi:hypothetical protein
MYEAFQHQAQQEGVQGAEEELQKRMPGLDQAAE